MARDSPAPSHRAFCLQTYMSLHARRDSLRKELQQNAHIDTTPTEFSPDNMARRSRNSSRSSTGSFSSSDLLELSRSTRSSMSSTSSEISTVSAPLQHASLLTVDSQPSPHPRRRRFSIPLESIDATTLEIAETRERLRAVNQQIKNTLTSMLNDENVQKDAKYRRWVNSRLKEAEEALADFI